MESLLTIRIWGAAAWADGTLHPAEAAALGRLIGASTDLTAEERVEAASVLERPPAVDLTAVRTMRPESREGVYRAVLAIVRLDRRVSAEEEAFLGRLRGVLDLDAATTARIEAEARP